MNSMFSWIGIDSLELLDLSNFDTSNVRSMNGMFLNARSLRYLNLSNFDTSNVVDINHMFSHLRLRELTLGANFHFVDYGGGMQIYQKFQSLLSLQACGKI